MILVAAVLLAGIFLQNQRSEKLMSRLLANLGEAIPDEPGAAAERMNEDGDGAVLPVLEREGVNCIGILSIPGISGRWPVGSPEESVQDLPCQIVAGDKQSGISGSSPEGSDSGESAAEQAFLTIAGMDTQEQFSALVQLYEGDEVEFTDVNGEGYTYQIVFFGPEEELQRYLAGRKESGKEATTEGDSAAETNTAAETAGSTSASGDITSASGMVTESASGQKDLAFDLELQVNTASVHPLIIGCKEEESGKKTQ